MSPGDGLQPSPPPLFRPQGQRHPPAGIRRGVEEQSPQAEPSWTGGLRSEVKEEASACRRMPGDMSSEDLPTATAPPGRRDPQRTTSTGTLLWVITALV